jgi:DNA-binding response OmpR family regulator
LKANCSSPIKTIWIIDSDAATQSIYLKILGGQYDCVIITSIVELAKAVESECPRPDLVLCEYEQNERNIPSCLEDLRRNERLSCPFIVVSTQDGLKELRDSYEKGALDYFVKSFSGNALRVKVEHSIAKLIIRSAASLSAFPDIHFDPATLRVRRGASVWVKLTAKEHQIFSVLYRSNGQAIPKPQLELEVWGKVSVLGKSLDVHVHNLRNKLRPLLIGVSYKNNEGYRICPID